MAATSSKSATSNATDRNRPHSFDVGLQSNRRTLPLGHANARNPSFSRDAQPVKLTVPAGSFKTNLVTLTAGDTTYRYWIETDAPYRLIKFESDGTKFELRGVERRAYWHRNWKSRFHAQGKAP